MAAATPPDDVRLTAKDSDARAELGRVLGRNVVSLRRTAGLSQEELGSRAGFTKKHISAIERAAVAPTLGAVDRIAYALGTTVARLLSGPADIDVELAGVMAGRSQKERQTALRVLAALFDAGPRRTSA